LDETLDGEHAKAVLTLSDQGVGIPPDMLEAVFEMFVQIDPSLDRTLGGLGLGLTVVKHVVERHGGKVKARSEGIGKGSQFALTLPRVAADPAPLPADDARPHAAQDGVLQVLLIEDNDDTRELMSTLLETRGHRVLCAADGSEGVQLATESPPAVALIDIGLPGMNGYAVARQLREALPLDGEPAPFLVALTGYGSPEDHQRASEAGFDAHMVKPIDATRLFELLQGVAERRRART
jgi:CheY-like chemotaxis protein